MLLGFKANEKKLVDTLISSMSLKGKVIVAPYLSKSDVIGLLQKCVLMIVPSNNEGYGIPVLEGLVHSDATVCSDIPIFREIADGHVHFFDLTDPMSLSKTIDDFVYKGPVKLDKFDYETYKLDVKKQREVIWERLNEL